jgi:hypothetical protein
MSRRLSQRLADSRGSTLVIAMMVMGVTVSLSLLIVSIAITSGRTSGSDRERLVSVNAAEAGIDAAYASIQSSGLNLPCTWPASGSADLKTYPNTASVQATLTYYGSTGAALACPLPAGAAPVRALISSVGTTGMLSGQVSRRRMEALVNLSPVSGQTFSKAIVGDSAISIANGAAVNGNVGSDADVYTNGNFACSNSPEIRGNVYARFGAITMTNTCTATGDVWALNDVTISGKKTIGGRVLSTERSVTLDGNTAVQGTVIAKGAISWSKCTASKCLANQSAVPLPPALPFPILRGDAATMDAWRAQGYTVISQPAGVGCGVPTGDWIKNNAAALTGKTLLRTSCAVAFQSTDTIRFAQDFALFADGGITTSNQVALASTDATTRNVHMVVPYDAATRPCSAPVMSIANNFSSTAQVTLLWYSPCDISYANNGGSYGAIYSGSTMSSTNAFTLNYRPVTVFGVDPASQPALSYKVDVVYKRENRLL